MGTSYKPSEVAELLGVSVDTVRRWCDDGRLANRRTTSGHRVIPGPELAAYLREHGVTREATGLNPQSTRNRLTGIVLRVERDTLTAIVELQAGPYRMVSLMTRDAADELALEPGDVAVAAVKATNVIVEVPR